MHLSYLAPQVANLQQVPPHLMGPQGHPNCLALPRDQAALSPDKGRLLSHFSLKGKGYGAIRIDRGVEVFVVQMAQRTFVHLKFCCTHLC